MPGKISTEAAAAGATDADAFRRDAQFPEYGGGQGHGTAEYASDRLQETHAGLEDPAYGQRGETDGRRDKGAGAVCGPSRSMPSPESGEEVYAIGGAKASIHGPTESLEWRQKRLEKAVSL